MTNEEKTIASKLGLLKLAERLVNVSEAYKWWATPAAVSTFSRNCMTNRMKLDCKKSVVRSQTQKPSGLGGGSCFGEHGNRIPCLRASLSVQWTEKTGRVRVAGRCAFNLVASPVGDFQKTSDRAGEEGRWWVFDTNGGAGLGAREKKQEKEPKSRLKPSIRAT